MIFFYKVLFNTYSQLAYTPEFFRLYNSSLLSSGIISLRESYVKAHWRGISFDTAILGRKNDQKEAYLIEAVIFYELIQLVIYNLF
jgi:hypothetical protein